MSLSYAEIQKYLNDIDTEGYSTLNISILRNITVEPIEPYLQYLAYNMGLVAKTQFGDYDTIFQDAIDGNAQLLNNTTHCVLVFVKLETLSARITHQFPMMTPEQIELEIERIDLYVSAVLNGIRQQTNAMILWMGFELPVNPALGILDTQTIGGQYGTIQCLNTLVLQTIGKVQNSYFLDLNLVVARIGSIDYFDLRYWHIGRAPFTRKALQEIASEVFKFIRALQGKNKKCLVLDCDNTLWGGVIGEDGLAGIKLSQSSYPGSSFYEFQQEIVNLYHRGILIALCSKNNADEVWNVFQNHPDMAIQESHIACAKINWDDKASNIRQIAIELNIGLDSLVFMDDSEFEINLVSEFLPTVKSIHLPIKRAAEYRSMLTSCGYFDTIAMTPEDLARGKMYQAEQQRDRSKEQFGSIERYHESLEMVAEFLIPDSFTIPRVAQLTQKTNQFNLTTRRYSEADITAFVNSNDSDAICLKLQDKFGNYGIVGACILTYLETTATIDSFLMSCRVLGRHVEDAFLAQIVSLARSRGCKILWGEYLPTEKNTQVAKLYTNFGFVEKSASLFHYDISAKSNLNKMQFIGKVVSQLLHKE
jgi:FkbH-like protein